MRYLRSSNFCHVTNNWELTVKIFTPKWGKNNERATCSFMYISEAIYRSPCMCVYVMYELVKKGNRVVWLSEIAKRLNNISNHTKRIYDLHCLCNILLVKIHKIKVCNPSPFRKTCFVMSLTKQCHVLFEITFHVFFFFFVEPHF